VGFAGHLRSSKFGWRLTAEFLGFVLLVSIISHLYLSRLGFNPTDDGFVLAGGRRVLEGQVPHRDFITIRPAGSQYLHSAVLLIGGDYVLLVSRFFVWIQHACIGWIWAYLASLFVFTGCQSLFEDPSTRDRTGSGSKRLLFAFISFVLSTYISAIMPWHSTDALFFFSVGILLLTRPSRAARYLGYFFLGASPLFRQNFLPLVPIALFVFDDFRDIRNWIAASMPLAAYAVFLASHGALADAIVQLRSHGAASLLRLGFWAYVKRRWTWIGAVVGVALGAVYVLCHRVKSYVFQHLIFAAGQVICFVLPAGVAASFALRGWRSIFSTAYAMFSVLLLSVVSLVLISLMETPDRRTEGWIRLSILVVTLGWCISLSGGCNSPIRAAGPITLSLLFFPELLSPSRNDAVQEPRDYGAVEIQPVMRRSLLLRVLSLLLMTVLLCACLELYCVSRRKYIYRERPSTELKYDLGDVLRGGRGIRTNERTYDFLHDLNRAVSIVSESGRIYAIVPDMAAYWIRSPEKNPLPSDWPQNTEIDGQLDKVVNALLSDKDRIAVIVEKYEANSIATKLKPIKLGQYLVVDYVRSSMEKVEETKYFEIYQFPPENSSA